MRRSSTQATVAVFVTVLLTVALSSSVAGKRRGESPVAEAVRSIRTLLAAGHWPAALAAAAAQLGSVTGGAEGEAPKDGERYLGELLVLEALAEAGLGRTEDAIWHWHAARNYLPVPECAGAATANCALAATLGDLDPETPAARLLRENPPECGVGRTAGCGVMAVDGGGDEPGGQPPLLVAAPAPALPAGLLASREPERLIVRAVVDTEGALREPVVLAGRSPVLAYHALEALRGWRFEPARRGDRPVPALVELTVPFAAEAPAGRLEGWRRRMDGIDAKVRAGATEEALAAARALVEEMATASVLGGSDLLARAEGLVALAEAALGRDDDAVWHWQVAQNLDLGLRYRDLAPYGGAGDLLRRHPLRLPATRPAPGGAANDGEETPERPPRARVAPEARFDAATLGHPDVARIEVLVGSDGRPREPVVLSGESPGLLLTALDALGEWRFTPAERGGRPVAVRFEATLPLGARQPIDRLPQSGWTKMALRAADEAERGQETLARCLWRSAQWGEPAVRGAKAASERAEELLVGELVRSGSFWSLDSAASPREGGDVVAPRKRFAPYPPYIETVGERRLQGRMIVQALVDRVGDVIEARMLKPASEVLNVATVETLCTWKFDPATQNGKPVDAYYILTTDLTLR